MRHEVLWSTIAGLRAHIHDIRVELVEARKALLLLDILAGNHTTDPEEPLRIVEATRPAVQKAADDEAIVALGDKWWKMGHQCWSVVVSTGEKQ